jgi:hypothetical protein
VFQPYRDFTKHGVEVREAAGQTLTVERAQFDLRDIQPTAVLGVAGDFQALSQAAGLGGRERFEE